LLKKVPKNVSFLLDGTKRKKTMKKKRRDDDERRIRSPLSTSDSKYFKPFPGSFPLSHPAATSAFLARPPRHDRRSANHRRACCPHPSRFQTSKEGDYQGAIVFVI
jgi:hypothetical protein